MNIHLHIERLVLDGVDVPGHRQAALQAALVSELSRLLAVGGLPAVDRQAVRVQAGSVDWAGVSDPVEMGTRLAGVVHGGLAQ